MAGVPNLSNLGPPTPKQSSNRQIEALVNFGLIERREAQAAPQVDTRSLTAAHEATERQETALLSVFESVANGEANASAAATRFRAGVIHNLQSRHGAFFPKLYNSLLDTHRIRTGDTSI